MNTMADGARERLVEQIGEALFGQPGLTLMELAEKVKGANEQPAHCSVKHCGMTYARIPRDGRCHACGGTVQPSPAGQGEACAQFEAWAAKEGLSDSEAGIAEVAWHASQKAALAASQPVGENPAWRDELVREAYNRGLADGLNADRQSVGQEPIGYRWRHSANEPWQYSSVPCGWEHEPLYAAPPAQAVDLGQFRDLIGFAILHAINLPETDPRRDFIRQANEFAKLIDSQAVGK